MAALLLAACDTPTPRVPPVDRSGTASALDGPHAAALADSVRAFADSIARGVSREGPGAWRKYFVDSPAFFMASEGRLVLPTSDSAMRAIQGLARSISSIELRWGDPVRVDPLAPGLAVMAATYHELRIDTRGRRVDETGFFTGIAEHRAGGWQLRDAHWSVATPPAAVP